MGKDPDSAESDAEMFSIDHAMDPTKEDAEECKAAISRHPAIASRQPPNSL